MILSPLWEKSLAAFPETILPLQLTGHQDAAEVVGGENPSLPPCPLPPASSLDQRHDGWHVSRHLGSWYKWEDGKMEPSGKSGRA